MEVDQQLSLISEELDQTEKEFILKRKEVRSFLKTSHNDKATQKYIDDIESTETRLEDIMLSLLELKAQKEFHEAATVLCQRCESLERYPARMQKDLAKDLHQKKKPKTDLVKNTTFLFGLPISFLLAVKNGLFHGQVTPEQAVGVGAAISSSVLCSEKIKTVYIVAKNMTYRVAEGSKKEPCSLKQEEIGSFPLQTKTSSERVEGKNYGTNNRNWFRPNL